MKIAVIHGPNINFLGIREPKIYGDKSYKALKAYIESEAEKTAKAKGTDLKLVQLHTNHEGEIIDLLQKFHNDNFHGIVLNPGALSHYSHAIADAISSIKPSVIEVHLTNIFAREEFRHRSVTASVCIGQITGFGAESYVLAINHLISTM
jgi:3-dehydroquinate dehydratase-2